MAREGILDRSLDGRKRRLMEHVGHSLHRPTHRHLVPDVSLEHHRLRSLAPMGPEHRLEVLAPTRRQIVEHDNCLAAAEESLDEVGADEAGAPGDEISARPQSYLPTPV